MGLVFKTRDGVYYDHANKVKLKCINNDSKINNECCVTREKYEKVKEDRDKWYKLWLRECRNRKL